MATEWLLVLAAGGVCGLVFTRFCRDVAGRIGWLDAPDNQRKIQARAVPVSGGVGVLLATLVALTVAAILSPTVAAALVADPRTSITLLIAAVLLTVIGLADDRFNLRARHKLLGQLLAIMVLIGSGPFLIERVSLFGWAVELGVLAVPFTIFWFLGCVNALNLIDGMDGLLGTVGFIALVSLAVMAGMTGNLFTVAVALALAGALAGFLWFNLPPASVYMGDAGSMLIGLAIGALAIPASLKGPATVALCAPVALLVLPMVDTSAAVIRRKLTGRGIATADRGHIHHVLMRHGLTVRRVLALVAGLALMAAAGALASTALQNDLFALVAVVGVVITLLATRLFGNAEYLLIRKRIGATVRAMRGGADGPAFELAVRLQGTADWDQVWQDLTGCAAQLNLQTVGLDVNAPVLHENYHARWDRTDRTGSLPAEAHLWRLEIPLFSHGTPIGRLTVTGGRDDEPISDKMTILSKIIETAEVRAAEARAADPTVRTPAPAKNLDVPVSAAARAPAVGV